MKPLAIVIPAYKARFLDETLRSIAAQNCRDFVVHVGDDASPENLRAICERWQGAFDLHYTRFANNLGRDDLVAQWQRCIDLGAEPWVWLFGDDDVMPADGVRLLLDAVEREGGEYELFHFNVEQLGADGRVRLVETEFPLRLSARDFALGRLGLRLASYAPDYAFSRAALARIGGFVRFPRAWCSDDATWISLAARSGIRTLDGAKVGWRRSGDNISSAHGADAEAKTQAQVQYLHWLDRFLREHPAAPGEPSDTEVMRWARPWFFHQSKLLRHRFFPGRAGPTLAALGDVRGFGPAATLGSMLRSDASGWVAAAKRRLRG